MLINDILDLSKIESGTVAVDVSELRLDDLHRSVERSFRHFAESKHVDFVDRSSSSRCPKSMVTDVKRLQQIIKNLLSNAFKFTHQGQVTFTIAQRRRAAGRATTRSCNRAGQVIAFSVSDTGIGISADKQQIIFEAFQQADGSTSRKYGGTGLGLAISRELSRLLGGEIRLVSAPGAGQHVHAVPAAELQPGAQRRASAPRGRPTPTRAGARAGERDAAAGRRGAARRRRARRRVEPTPATSRR